MAIRTFRLTHIDARRLYGVACCDTAASRLRRNVRLRTRSPGSHDSSEGSRAIHGCPREPHTYERGGVRIRSAGYSLMLRFTD